MGLPVARVFVDKDTPHCGDVLLRMATNNVNVFVGGMPAAKFADPNSPHLPPGCIGVASSLTLTPLCLNPAGKLDKVPASNN